MVRVHFANLYATASLFLDPLDYESLIYIRTHFFFSSLTPLFISDDGPNIPVIFENHQHGTIGYGGNSSTNNEDHKYCNKPWKLFNDVWWGTNGGMSNRMWREIHLERFDANHVADYQIDFGALPNYHPYRSNIIFYQPSNDRNAIVYDDYTHLQTAATTATTAAGDVDKNTGRQRNYYSGSNNPLKGSFSYYNGKEFVVDDNDVDAGMELFLDYGPHWFDGHNPDGKTYVQISRRDDYYLAATVLKKFAKRSSNNNDNSSSSSSSSSSSNNNIINDNNATEILKSIQSFKEFLVFVDSSSRSELRALSSSSLEDNDNNCFILLLELFMHLL